MAQAASSGAVPEDDAAAEQMLHFDNTDYPATVTLANGVDDSDNPRYKTEDFDKIGLHPLILQGLAQQSFRKASPIQRRALPLLLINPPQNLIGQAESGGGKTAAFILNILNRIDLTNQNPQALVLAPTRELANQIVEVATKLGNAMPNLRVCAVVNSSGRRLPECNGHIIIGTPGTVVLLLQKKVLQPNDLRILVLDEADAMLKDGHKDSSRRVKHSIPQNVQVNLFSATFPENVIDFAQDFCPNANKIKVKSDKNLVVKGIKQFYFDCDTEADKYHNLIKFYTMLTVNSSIIFCKTRRDAREIGERMKESGHVVDYFSAELDGDQRDRVVERFRAGKTKVLMATDVLARGIDVPTVTLVINYNIPQDQDGRPNFETYYHRIGRTGRYGKVGVAVTFISDKMQWEKLRQIAEHFSVQIDSLNGSDWDQVEETVGKAMKNKPKVEEDVPAAGVEAKYSIAIRTIDS